MRRPARMWSPPIIRIGRRTALNIRGRPCRCGGPIISPTGRCAIAKRGSRCAGLRKPWPMRRREGAGSIDVPVRAFSYDFEASGPELTRAVAVEAPIQIVIGGAPFAVMMATPNDLEDFAYGFALTEQIANSVADIRGVEVESVEDGWKLKIALSGERLQAHLARGRAMSGRTGCGLCGIEDFSQMPSPRPVLPMQSPVGPEAIRAAVSELEAKQPLNQATRAVHGAAWC